MTVDTDAPVAPPARSRTLSVAEVVAETKDSVTISFEIPDSMVEDFKQIRRAAGLSEELTVVETAMAQ